MAPLPAKRDQEAADFHPAIYKITVGLVALFVVAACATFARRGDTGESLVMVTLLLFIAVMIPYLMRLTWKHQQRPQPTLKGSVSFRDCAAGSTEIWQSRVKGADAAIDALLPIAAVAIGILMFGIAFDIVGHSVG
jgi:hypothetical protein